jgi:hypothetical protein
MDDAGGEYLARQRVVKAPLTFCPHVVSTLSIDYNEESQQGDSTA